MTLIKNPMHLWFIYLFEQRMDKNHYVKCFECDKRMHEDTWKMNSCCYSHILSKKTYPQYAGNEVNLKIVHADCHNLYTIAPRKAKNQFAEYNKLLEKHKNKELI